MRIDRVSVAALLALGVFGSSGCSTMNNTEKGLLAGGAVGTGVGGLIGHATGNTGLGAVTGGLIGGGLGAVAGNSADRQDQRERDIQQAGAVAAATAQAQQQRLGLSDVMHLSREGHDDAVIIKQIQNTGSTFNLTPSDLDMLKNNGVSPQVITAMQSARPAVVAPTRVVPASSTVIVQEPLYYPPPPVIVRPYCPPPPRAYIQIGGGHYHHRHCHW
jgi:hypothetical protein